MAEEHIEPPRLTYCSPEGERKVELPAVRSRWIPKPGQITILESIFNSGMVNPSKEATEMIRKMLEKYGHVSDTSIFYWFQNRRSKSRRHQRKLLQSQAQSHDATTTTLQFADYMSAHASSSSSPVHGNDSCDHSFISFSDPVQEYGQNNQIYCPPGMITVFINGFRTEVGRGPVDMRTMFTGSLVMYDSSGNLVEMNEYGIVVQGLRDGESYVVVSHP